MAGFTKRNKYLFAKHMFKHLAVSSLDSLNDLTDSIYSSLKKELAAYDIYVKKRVKEIPEELHDEFYDYMSDDYWKYAEGFPQITGYILLVRYYSLLEYTLRSIGQNVEHSQSKKMKDIKRKGSYIEHYLKYLKNIAGFNIDLKNSSWAYIQETINPIRNCITHDDGYIEDSDKAKKLKKIIADNPTLLALTSFNQIEIKKEFVYHFQEVINAFLKYIFQVWQAWAEEKGKEK